MTARILLIEDDDELREAMLDVLDAEGLAVITAAHGAEALSMLEASAEPPDVIVMDLMMPVMDGETFLTHHAANPELASVPVIVLTAQSKRAAALDGRVLAVLTKPVNVQQLLSSIRAACDVARKRATTVI